MYKMYKKDRGQWVEVASFEYTYQARVYANAFKYAKVDNPNEENNYYYKADTWTKDNCRLKEPLTEEQLEDLENDYNCLEETHGIVKCQNCGRLIGLNYSSDNYVEIDGNYYCDYECADNDGNFYCNHCETWYRGNDYYTIHDGSTICSDCYYDCYGTCEDCGEIFHSDDLEYGDDDCYYCCNCIGSHNNGIIKGYHSTTRPSIQIQTTEEDLPQDATFGTEVETECKGSCSRGDVASQINDIVNKDKTLFLFEDDGSLSENGYETISQPFTMRWFTKNQDLFRKMFEKMITLGCRSHDTTTCGFHVHFGRHFFGNKETECIDRLIYLFEKYKAQLEVFSRRKNFEWCRFPSDRVCSPVEWSKIDEVKKLDKYNFQGHHSAINLENRNTIEIRIFKGTLNFNTYYATLELVNNMITYVRDKSDVDVEKSSFSDIINYLPTIHLKQYCLDRNII